MRKILLAVSIGIMVLTLTGGVYADNYAKLNVNGTNVNIKEWGSPYWQSSKKRDYDTRDKVTYALVDGAYESKSSLYFDIEDRFSYGQQCDMTVTVEYYDEGNTNFSVNYESYNPDLFIYEKKMQNATLTGTNTLKTVSFELSDVVLENRFSYLNGSDFYINLEEDSDGNKGKLLIKSVKFSINNNATFLKTDLRSDEYGNIFTGSEQSAVLEVTNMSGQNYGGTLQCFVVYDDEEVIDAWETPIDLSADETKQIPFKFNYSKYGIYDLQVKLINGDKLHADVLPFSVINPTAYGEGNEKFNVCTHFARYGNEALNAISLAGFGGIRGGIAWSMTEREKGVYSVAEHAEGTTADVKAAGMNTLLTLTYGNRFYDQEEYMAKNDGKVSELVAPYTDEGIAAYAAYCSYIAETYKDYIEYYEIWNEYNLQGFNLEMRGPEVYAKMLKAASVAIKEKDPDAKIVAMATSQVDVEFIKAVLAEGTEDYFDVITVHPYQWSGSYSEEKFLYHMNRVKAVTDKPIWCSELGWSSSEHEWGVTEKEQAIFGVQEYVIAQAKNLCDRIYWYDFQNDGTEKTEIENNFGVIEATTAEDANVAKPSYVAFAAMNKLLADREFVDCIENDSYRAYRFEDAKGEDVLVLWGETETQVVLDLGTDNVQIMDMYSNVKEDMVREHGIYKILLDDEITYIRGDFTNFAESEVSNLRYCNVRYKDGYVYVDGEAGGPEEEITVYIYSDNNAHIYSDQITSDSFAKFSFEADVLGESEVYVVVNYGEILRGKVPGVVIKLMCNGKEITSAEQISGDVELVISINKALTEDVDIYAASYFKNRLQNVIQKGITAGQTGEYRIPLTIENGMTVDSISGFVWSKNLVPIAKKDF